jgi:DNA recombination protein RmuC
MTIIFDIVLFGAGLLLGAVGIWLAGSADARTLRDAIGNRDARLDKLQGDLTEAIAARAGLEAQLSAMREVAAEKLALLDEAKKKMSDAFMALSVQALQSNNDSFLALAKTALEKQQLESKTDLEKRQTAIDQTLKPVRESLEKVDAKISELEKSRAGAYAALNEQVKALTDGQTALRSETSNLVNALRSPTVRGRWGEIQLRRVVEMAGMLAHCDFFEQQTVTTEDGRLRPDLRVRLPGNKNIIVDAKTPLESYLKSLEAPNEDARRDLLRAHAQSVRTHMNNLGKKAYWDQFKDDMPDLVIMFLPGEMFFSAALEADPTLIEGGIDQNIILATPTTLIGLLRAVHYGWRQEKITEAAQKISDLGRDLYKRLADMSEHFFKLGKSLGGSVEAYNKAVGSLETRVLVSARKFKDITSVPSDSEIEDLAPVEQEPRALQAPEMVSVPDGLFPLPEPQVTDEADGSTESARSLAAMADLSSAMPAPVLADVKMPKSPKSAADTG